MTTVISGLLDLFNWNIFLDLKERIAIYIGCKSLLTTVVNKPALDCHINLVTAVSWNATLNQNLAYISLRFRILQFMHFFSFVELVRFVIQAELIGGVGIYICYLIPRRDRFFFN